MRRVLVVALAVAAIAAAALWRACRPSPEQQSALQAPAAELARAALPEVVTPDPHVDRTGWPVIVAFGDSLTAGLGVEPDRNYPSQLQALLDQRGYRYRVVNAGVSEELTAGGLSRVDQVLEHRPVVVILELGANDGMQARVPLIPFFLEGVAGSPYLNQRDGIHPTAEGYAIVVRTVLAALEPLLPPP